MGKEKMNKEQMKARCLATLNLEGQELAPQGTQALQV